MQKSIFIIGLLLGATAAWSTVWVLPSQDNSIGEIQYAIAKAGENVLSIGLSYDMGYYEMHRANPKLPLSKPLPAGTRVIIPSRHILPQALRKGIVISLSQYRLYYFIPHENTVLTFPIGIGRLGWETPIGHTTIIKKEYRPVWHPSKNLQNDAANKGILLPDTFPPGTHNPLGDKILRLGWATYLIHGSSQVTVIGKKVSAGCIRLLPEDMDYLFDIVSVNTSVRVVA